MICKMVLLPVMNGQAMSGHVRSGQVRSGQVRSGQVTPIERTHKDVYNENDVHDGYNHDYE